MQYHAAVTYYDSIWFDLYIA